MILIPLCESVTHFESDLKNEEKNHSVSAENCEPGLNCALVKFECGVA